MKTLPASICAFSLFLSGTGFSQEAPKEIKPVAPVQTEQPAPATAAPVEYVIRSGDNPWKIAKDHSVSLDDLLAANEIEDATNLKIGDVLLIPDGQTAPAPKPVAKKVEAPAPAAAETAAPDGAEWEYYTIKSGDNPWSISRALKLDHQKIMALNEGMNFNDLKIGQQIKIPKK